MQYCEVLVTQCVHSRFNTRKTRGPEQVARLADRIRRNGFERTRALWAVGAGATYEVFAGGTRLEAARAAGLETVPVFVYTDLTEDDIARLADRDNENDEYHAPVSVLDVWAEYHRLSKEEGWTQQRIADAKGCDRTTVAQRIGWHTNLCDSARHAVLDGVLDEGHLSAFSGVALDVQQLAPWLTTERAQTELVTDVLAKHRGKSADIKPTVKVVREAAKRWKDLVAAAQTACATLSREGGRWADDFVARLVAGTVRTVAGVDEAFGWVSARIAAAKRAEIDTLTAEEAAAQAAAARAARLAAYSARIVHGDAREHIAHAPTGFELLLTDPPYGIEFQSNRRTATAKKPRIANDGAAEAVALVADVLARAFPLMADDATLLVFTGWRHEPAVRAAVEGAGFTVRGSLVWVKNNHGTGDLAGAFAPKHERIIHAVKGNPKLFGARPADVLDGHDVQNSDHPTEKPRDLLAALIEATTAPGHVVVDPFAGSGGTVYEAHRLGRGFYAVELDEGWHRQLVDGIHALVSREV